MPDKLVSFQQDVLDTNKDFNLISGRLLARKILKDSNYVLKKLFLKKRKKSTLICWLRNFIFSF